MTWPDGSTTRYTWDAGNRVTKIEDSQSGAITNEWDIHDRLIKQTTPTGSVSYTWYANGLRKTMTARGQPTLRYEWDAANQLKAITQDAGAINGDTPQTATFQYNANGQLIQTTLLNGQSMHYGWNNAGELTSILYRNADGSYNAELAYVNDTLGRRIAVNSDLNLTHLPEEATASHNIGNRLTSHNASTLQYDATGNLTSDGTNTYTWNARGQLTKITDAATNSETASFTYDAMGRRQSKTTNGHTIRFVYDGINIVQELDGENATNADPNAIRASYISAGVDRVLARQSPTSGTYHYLSDALGSTTRLTDDNGATLVNYSYDPYGGTRADAQTDNPFQYTGRENDGTGLYYYRARYYSPAYQRFISEDPIGLDGGINVYAYVEGNPVSYTDPLGLLYITSVDAACLQNPMFCAELFGQMAKNAAALSGDECLQQEAEQFARTLENAAIVAGVAGGAGSIKNAASRPKKKPSIAQEVSNKPLGLGSTGRVTPHNLKEQLAMEQALANPAGGKVLTNIQMTDKRWHTSNGWVKMSQNINGVEIHYVRNPLTGAIDDFKFK